MDMNATAAFAMNGDTTTSYNDWRLPSVEELNVFTYTVYDGTPLWTGTPSMVDGYNTYYTTLSLA